VLLTFKDPQAVTQVINLIQQFQRQCRPGKIDIEVALQIHGALKAPNRVTGKSLLRRFFTAWFQRADLDQLNDHFGMDVTDAAYLAQGKLDRVVQEYAHLGFFFTPHFSVSSLALGLKGTASAKRR